MSFLVLPDHPAGIAIARRWESAPNATVLIHHSGRPWVLGRWRPGTAIHAEVGDVRALVLGRTGLGATELAARLRQVRSVVDLDALAASLPGTFHLVASVAGVVRAQGSLSTARQIFHTVVDGVTVAADGASALAALAGAEVDEEALAVRLLSLWPPAPLADRCAWRGVRSLPMGHHLVVRADGAARTRRWWTPPEPEVPLTEAAPVLRDALTEGVRVRAGDGLSADLSGGMDSTSLCYLAADLGVEFRTLRYRPLDPTNDDDRWASWCQERLPGADHLVVDGERAPHWYADTAPGVDTTDEPVLFVRSRAMMERTAELVARHGATTHLQGINGDELFRPSPMCVHALARTHPLTAYPHVRALRAMRRWSAVTTARFLWSNPPYPRWLAACADRLTEPRAWGAEFEWEIPPKTPRWATPDAVAAARRQLATAAADSPEPLSPLPVQHAMMRITRVNGAATRHNNAIGAVQGVSFESPYLDDRVLEVALSVRLADRLAIGRYKPVLTAAMRGAAPEEFLGRQTKGDFSAELYRGLRARRREMLDLFEDSYLARLGLIDPSAVRDVLLGLHTDSRPLMPLDATLACESWLRAVHETPIPEEATG